MAEQWVRVAATADVAEGAAIAVKLGQREVALYHLPGGEFRATDNVCSHEYAQLHEGWLENGEIECPLHAGKFDVRTGKATAAPCEVALEVFEVKVEGADLLVKVPG
ncbi:MAG TPA: non-heme iron oxygenase ferredoxin subunit [Acetobacteraceae bacterium]|jgi:nitrite reductase/ring-hydroxylating ferredoxin subunit|nr:non-heme iron oxygenase ferredoxin subunit [Acetobacteraceae bacterium]